MQNVSDISYRAAWKRGSVLRRTTLVLALVAAACATPPSAPTIEGRWSLSELAGAPPVAGTAPWLLLASGHALSGAGGCNSFAGRYENTGARFAIIGELEQTLLVCGEGDRRIAIMAQERTFIAAISHATRAAIDGDHLVLDTPSGPVRLRRVR